MRFNVSDNTEPLLWNPEWVGAKAFMDGNEIPYVYFADEEAGIIKTYWIDGVSKEGDPAIRAAGWRPQDFPGREVLCAQDDVLREILRGKVTIQLP